MNTTRRPRRLNTPVGAMYLYCRTRCALAEAESHGLHGGWSWTVGYAVIVCPHNDCPLHPYRRGRQPGRAGIGPGSRPDED